MSRFSPRENEQTHCQTVYNLRNLPVVFLSTRRPKRKKSSTASTDAIGQIAQSAPGSALLSLLQPPHPWTEPQGGLIARFSLSLSLEIVPAWRRTKRVKKREREREKGIDGGKENATYLGFLIRCIDISSVMDFIFRRCTLVNAVVCGRNFSRHGDT